MITFYVLEYSFNDYFCHPHSFIIIFITIIILILYLRQSKGLLLIFWDHDFPIFQFFFFFIRRYLSPEEYVGGMSSNPSHTEDAFIGLPSWATSSLGFQILSLDLFVSKFRECIRSCLFEFNMTETLEVIFIFISLRIVWFLCTRNMIFSPYILVIKNSF